MDKIYQMLKQNKPDITDSSIRAYTAPRKQGVCDVYSAP